jgi:hypothetical protein
MHAFHIEINLVRKKNIYLKKKKILKKILKTLKFLSAKKVNIKTIKPIIIIKN